MDFCLASLFPSLVVLPARMHAGIVRPEVLRATTKPRNGEDKYDSPPDFSRFLGHGRHRGQFAGPRGTIRSACQSLVPAAMGGPLLDAENMIALRWLATSNFELVYRGQVFLLDAYFDRGPRNRPTGIVPNEVKKTDAIFIGHAHFDHISDVGPIAQRTKAKVIGAPISVETAYKLGVPAGQGTAVAGGETLQIRQRHGRRGIGRALDSPSPRCWKFWASSTMPTPGPRPKPKLRLKSDPRQGHVRAGSDHQGHHRLRLHVPDGVQARLDRQRRSDHRRRSRTRAQARAGRHCHRRLSRPSGRAGAGSCDARTREAVQAAHLHSGASRPDLRTFVDLGVEPLFEAIQVALPGTETIPRRCTTADVLRYFQEGWPISDAAEGKTASAMPSFTSF